MNPPVNSNIVDRRLSIYFLNSFAGNLIWDGDFLFSIACLVNTTSLEGDLSYAVAPHSEEMVCGCLRGGGPKDGASDVGVVE
jgi:hypothetical protein